MWKHSFRIVSCDSPETMRKLCFFAKFLQRKSGEIKVFFAVEVLLCKNFMLKHLDDKNMRKEELEDLKKRLDELQGQTLSLKGPCGEKKSIMTA